MTSRFALAVSLALGMIAPAFAEIKEVPVVKYADLLKEIKKHHGKVVLIDFWADFCLPCKLNMPKLVDLQEKYGSQGLVVITVSLDPLDGETHSPPEVRAGVAKFLTKTKAEKLVNVHLDMPQDDWVKKFRFTAIPCHYLFDRHGKWIIEKHPDPKHFAEFEKTIQELLQES